MLSYLRRDRDTNPHTHTRWHTSGSINANAPANGVTSQKGGKYQMKIVGRGTLPAYGLINRFIYSHLAMQMLPIAHVSLYMCALQCVCVFGFLCHATHWTSSALMSGSYHIKMESRTGRAYVVCSQINHKKNLLRSSIIQQQHCSFITAPKMMVPSHRCAIL